MSSTDMFPGGFSWRMTARKAARARGPGLGHTKVWKQPRGKRIGLPEDVVAPNVFPVIKPLDKAIGQTMRPAQNHTDTPPKKTLHLTIAQEKAPAQGQGALSLHLRPKAQRPVVTSIV